MARHPLDVDPGSLQSLMEVGEPRVALDHLLEAQQLGGETPERELCSTSSVNGHMEASTATGRTVKKHIKIYNIYMYII